MSFITENFETQTAGGFNVSRETLRDIIDRMSEEEFKNLIYNLSISLTITDNLTTPLYSDIMSHTPELQPLEPDAFITGAISTTATFNHNMTNSGLLVVPLASDNNIANTNENITSPTNMGRLTYTHIHETTEFYNNMVSNGVEGYISTYHLLDYNWSNMVYLVKVKYYTDYNENTKSEWVDLAEMPEGAKISDFNIEMYYGDSGERVKSLPYGGGNIALLVFSDFTVNNTSEYNGYYSQKILTNNKWSGYGYKLLPLNNGGIASFGALTQNDTWGYIPDDFNVQANEIIDSNLLLADYGKHTYISKEMLIHIINQLGGIWTDSVNYVSDELTSDNIHFPLIGINGATGGDTSGEANSQNGLWGKTDIGGDKNWKLPENPEEDIPDPNSYVDSIGFGVPALTPINLFSGYYAMSYNEVLALNDYLWNTDETIFTALLESLKLMGNNPINFLSNLKLYPFDLSNYGVLTNKNIVVGRVDTGLTGGQLPSNYHVTFDLGSCYIYPYNKDFSDYTNTRMFIYLPFIGSREIQASEFMNKTLTARYVVDIITGACTCGVFADGIPMFYADGVMGVDIPLTGDNSHELYSKVLQSTLGTVTAVFDKDIAGVINGADNMWTSTAVTPQKTGASSPSCGHSLPLKAYVVVERCKEEIPSNYGARVGFLYNKTVRLGDCRGFTIVENFEADIPNILQPEYDKLVEMMNKGVRL